MKTKLSIGLAIALFIASCGGPSTDLDAKKKELAKLKSEIKELDKKVAKLESDIAILDTAAEESLVAVKVDPVKAGAFSNLVGIQGMVTSNKNVKLNAEMGGMVKNIYVKEGQKVSKGQTLVRLDGAQVASQLAQLKNALELATTAFNKQKRLWDQKIGSEMQYLQAKNQKEDLENQINTINAQASKFVVRSPINGTIDKLFINQGEIAGPGSPLVQVVDASQIKIEADISENYIGKFKVGDKVKVRYPALNETTEETISAVGQVIDAQSRTFTLTIVPKKKNKNLKPNLLAIIDVADFESDSSITVFTKLVRQEGDKRFVYVLSKNEEGQDIVVKKYIIIDKSFSTNTVVKSGLNVGDKVIVEGYQAVVENDLVKVIQ